MKTNFSLLFYLKKPKNYQSGLVPIYLRITVNGKRSETTTGRECDPSLWNSIAGRLKGTKEDTKSFYNTDLRLDIEKIKNKLDNQDKNMEIVLGILTNS
jgi:hypothetical protein